MTVNDQSDDSGYLTFTAFPFLRMVFPKHICFIDLSCLWFYCNSW